MALIILKRNVVRRKRISGFYFSTDSQTKRRIHRKKNFPKKKKNIEKNTAFFVQCNLQCLQATSIVLEKTDQEFMLVFVGEKLKENRFPCLDSGSPRIEKCFESIEVACDLAIALPNVTAD